MQPSSTPTIIFIYIAFFWDSRNRIVLQRQFEFAKLEKRLDELDELDNTPSRSYRLASIEWDQEAGDSTRQDLIEVIDKKLEQYDMCSHVILVDSAQLMLPW